MGVKRDPDDRFVEKIGQPDENGCWPWMSKRNPCNGYGEFWPQRRKTVKAHRYSYELFVGPIGEGLEIDHLCRVRRCVNPAHLEPVTPAVNMQRMGVFRRSQHTACGKGHEYTVENTYFASTGARHCRTCARLRARTNHPSHAEREARALAAGRACIANDCGRGAVGLGLCGKHYARAFRAAKREQAAA